MRVDLDYELWKRARALFGPLRAVVLMTCPRCEQRSLIWSGKTGTGVQCLSCGLDYRSFAELIEGRELEIAAKQAEISRAMVERHDAYRRVRGRVRQVRNG